LSQRTLSCVSQEQRRGKINIVRLATIRTLTGHSSHSAGPNTGDDASSGLDGTDRDTKDEKNLG
jgi:hypothetical protein